MPECEVRWFPMPTSTSRRLCQTSNAHHKADPVQANAHAHAEDLMPAQAYDNDSSPCRVRLPTRLLVPDAQLQVTIEPSVHRTISVARKTTNRTKRQRRPWLQLRDQQNFVAEWTVHPPYERRQRIVGPSVLIIGNCWLRDNNWQWRIGNKELALNGFEIGISK